MLRVSPSGPKGLRLDGSLTGATVAELERVCEEAGAAGLSLDLAGISYLDAVGAAAICRLADCGVDVRGASPFVAELLEEHRS